MQATVTGGAGFIGSAVVRELLQAGHDVVVLDDLSQGRLDNLAGLPRVRVVVGDVGDAAKLAEALAGSEVVFHMAAHVGNVRSIEDPGRDSTVNVLGTLAVLEAMRKLAIRRLVYSSSAAIYGESRHLPVDEMHPAEPDSPYGVSKLAAEKHCLCYAKIHGWSVACLRYFNVFGERQRFDAYGNVIPIFGTRLIKGETLTIYGDGRQTRDFVHVRDVARANVMAAAAEVTGAFNIATGEPNDILSLAGWMAEAAGGKAAIKHGPPRAGEVRESYADIAAARRAFGYAPRERLAEALPAYLAWLRSDMAAA